MFAKKRNSFQIPLTVSLDVQLIKHYAFHHTIMVVSYTAMSHDEYLTAFQTNNVSVTQYCTKAVRTVGNSALPSGI